MSRLTKRNADGTVWYNHTAEREVKNGDLLERLCHYEDLKEQGRLIELPCKEGDTVWVCWFGNDETNSEPSVYDITAQNEPMCILIKDLWGIKFFATKAEAEAKLAEIQKGE